MRAIVGGNVAIGNKNSRDLAAPAPAAWMAMTDSSGVKKALPTRTGRANNFPGNGVCLPARENRLIVSG